MPKRFDLSRLELAKLAEYIKYDKFSGSFIWIKKPSSKVVIGRRAGHLDSSGYRVLSFEGQHYYEHLIAWNIKFGPIPKGMVIDHIDGDRSNNSLSNLRLITQGENTKNVVRSRVRMGPDGATLPQGVCWVERKGKYTASIKNNYKKIHLGTFFTPSEAHNAYINAKRILHPKSTESRLK